MATTTPNFGWSVPTSTDLVKDGATAIETLGDSIDASLVDLKGGTTGQVLAKATNTDMDFSWVAQDDSNAIQNAIVDAKGDLITATANDTPARLAVGANNTVLTADSGQATGLKWAAVSAPTTSGVLVTRATNVSVANGTITTIDFTTEKYDTDAFHDNATNPSRLTVPAGKAGYYWVYCTSVFDDASATGSRSTYITANVSGSDANYYAGGTGNPTNQGDIYHSFGVAIYLAVGDYVRLRAYQTSGGALDYIGDGVVSRFGMYYIGA
jgi:hypothetical protein